MMVLIKGKEAIRFGDRTTHGGRVIRASVNVFYDGYPLARVGDAVTCPKCNGTHVITEGAESMYSGSVLIAYDGCATSCGARLIAHSNQEGLAMMEQDVARWTAAASAPLKEASPPPKQLMRTAAVTTHQGGYYSSDADDDDYEVIPGRKLSKEEYCRVAEAIQNDPTIRMQFQWMANRTKEHQFEYSAWIIETSPGVYTLTDMKTDKHPTMVAPGSKPANAVAQVHTHVFSGAMPSRADDRYYSTREDKCLVYFIIDTTGYAQPLNDEGRVLMCD